MNILHSFFYNKKIEQEWFEGSLVIYKSVCLDDKLDKLINFEHKLESSNIVIGQSTYEGKNKKNIVIGFKKDYLLETEMLEKNALVEIAECCKNEVESCNINNLKLEQSFNFDVNENSVNKSLDKRLSTIKLLPSNKGVKFEIFNKEKNNLLNLSHADAQNEILKMKQFGRKYFEDRNHYILRPISFSFDNEEINLAYFSMDTFSNGMITFRIIIPIKKQSFKMIEEDSHSQYINEIIYPYFISSENMQMKDFRHILNCYIYEISKETGYELYNNNDEIMHYIISKSSYNIKTFSKIKEYIKESLFIALNYPYNHKDTLKKDTSTFFKEQVYGKDYVKTLISTKGKCISLLEEDKNVLITNEVSEEEMFLSRITTAMQFSELSINIMTMLKVNYKFIYDLLNISNQWEDVLFKFRTNMDYIYSLYEDSYGSVLEQIDFFKQAMKYYISEDIYLNRIKYIQENIKEKRERRFTNIGYWVSVITILFTLIFGLPAINDTYNILKNDLVSAQPEMTNNINVPVFLWTLILIFIFIFAINGLRLEIYNIYIRMCTKFKLRYKIDLDYIIKNKFKTLVDNIKVFLYFIIIFFIEIITAIVN